jgi:hypothetical protein
MKQPQKLEATSGSQQSRRKMKCNADRIAAAFNAQGWVPNLKFQLLYKQTRFNARGPTFELKVRLYTLNTFLQVL